MTRDLSTIAKELIETDPALAEEVRRQLSESQAIGLTPNQSDLLAYIRRYMREYDGVAPTFADMAEYMGCARSGVFALLNGLVERGAISRIPGRSRAISILRVA